MELATEAKKTIPPESRQRTMTERVLETHWEQGFREPVTRLVRAVPRSYDEILPFVKRHFQEIYGHVPGDSRFFHLETTPCKSSFYQNAIDLFSLDSLPSGKMIGIFAGQLTDWSTYYIRNISILPAHQRGGAFSSFLARLVTTLSDRGVLRLECDTFATNTPAIQFYLKFGFHPTGTLNSERWGSLLRFTYFLSDPHRDAFYRQFIASTPAHRGRQKTNSTENSGRGTL